ncbi:hypothetical protein MN608_06678 [Microdochium nivale]|nr:hypothetical protein MN608_06678 [Microdochium nivale]
MILMSKGYKRNVNWALEVLLPQIEAGKHSGLPGFKPEWKNDTAEIIQSLREESITAQKSDEERYHCEMHWDFLRSVGDKIITTRIRIAGQEPGRAAEPHHASGSRGHPEHFSARSRQVERDIKKMLLLNGYPI